MKVNLRSILAAIYTAIYLVISLPYHVVIRLIGKKDPMKKYRSASKVVRFAFRFIFLLAGIKLHAEGVERIPKDEPVLFVMNHRSYMDILAQQIACGVPVGFIAKKELKKIPLLGFLMSDIGCVFLDRSNGRAAIKSIQTGVDIIKSGCCMTICPEGTRSHDLDVKPFKDGSLKLATKAKVKVVPVAIMGSDECFENTGGLKLRPGHIFIEYGEPLDVINLPEEEKKHLGAYTHAEVCRLYENVKARWQKKQGKRK